MTNKEKANAIGLFCLNKRCDKCELAYLCAPIKGEFISHEEVCEKAYEIIMNLLEKAPDNVNHPSHYETGKFECIDVMIETQGEEAVKTYCLCAAFKYLYRHKRNNGLEDIKKARWYLNKYIELEEATNGL